LLQPAIEVDRIDVLPLRLESLIQLLPAQRTGHVRRLAFILTVGQQAEPFVLQAPPYGRGIRYGAFIR